MHINVNETLHLYGDRLFYHGKTYQAELFGHVVLQDEKARLETSHLVFNRKTHLAYYDQHGIIHSDSNILKSKSAYYNTLNKIFHFQKEVNLTNRDQVTTADTLIYNTNNKTAYFRGLTTIKGSKKVPYGVRKACTIPFTISQSSLNIPKLKAMGSFCRPTVCNTITSFKTLTDSFNVMFRFSSFPELNIISCMYWGS